MKKIRNILLFLLTIVAFPLTVNAASANISVNGASSAIVGNNVTLTVRLSSGTAIGSWQMILDYDRNYLQFVGGGGESGSTNMVNSSSGTTSKSYTFTFKAKKSGSTKVHVGNYSVYASNDMSAMSVSSSAKTVNIITQAQLEASYSKDNNLKSLGVEGFELTTPFNKDTLEYSVKVPEGTKTINIVAVKADGNASIVGDGAKEVSPGTNSFEIVVKAQNGAEKTYKLAVDVIDENPVEIKIGKDKYTLVKYKVDERTCPTSFVDGTAKIGEFEVPSCQNDKIKYTLVVIKDEKGKLYNAVYKNGKYEIYKEIIGTSVNIIPLEYKGTINHYTKKNIDINGISVNAFQYKNNKRFIIVYGLNVATGSEDLYMYDMKDKTLMLYNDDLIKDLDELNNYYLYASIALSAGLLLSFICIIVISKKKKKKHKNKAVEDNKIKVEKVSENKTKDNEISVIERDEDFYDIMGKKKKSKKK